ncbi:MAG: FAD:protein FMN transferase [Cyclobacteriaceae bacterium]
MMKKREFRRGAKLMGSAFEFVLIAREDEGEKLLDECVAEVKRIEVLLTEFSETSQTAQINKAAGIDFVKVDAETFQIIQRSLGISKLTQGAFDITAGVLKRLYNFKGNSFSLPEKKLIQQTMQKVGYQKIELSGDNRVKLKTAGMHIGFGAIGKGYAADKVKTLLMEKGIESGVINASGDLTAWGTRVDGSLWKVAIADPNDKEKIIAWIPIKDASVATSGDYEQYFEYQGKRYSHTIDPKTGLPVSGIKSVTIVGPSAELSDALATAVFTMGVEVGLHFVKQLPHTHALIVNEHNKVFTSKNIKINFRD